jgi:two-component system KDP operon response regulator KdpE
VRDAESMKVRALDEGADDYVTKPFSMPELLARIRAQLRRSQPTTSGARLEVGDFVLDEDAHRITIKGVPLSLTPKEFELLRVFAQSPERVLTHRVLVRRIWGEAHGEQIENLRVLIASLRKKLEHGGPTRYIESEPWIGYRFMPGGITLD